MLSMGGLIYRRYLYLILLLTTQKQYYLKKISTLIVRALIIHKQSVKAYLLYNEMILANLCVQFHSIYNSNNKTLDFCFSNADVNILLISKDCHHPAINIFLKVHANVGRNNFLRYLFNKADFLLFNEFFMYFK